MYIRPIYIYITFENVDGHIEKMTCDEVWDYITQLVNYKTNSIY